MKQPTKRAIAKALMWVFFKDQRGKNFKATNGQADIFNIIFLKEHLYNQIIASTQYGKSEVVAMAIILRSIIYREDWIIISGTNELAQIIMRKVIAHMFDHPSLKLQIDPAQVETIEKLKHERSRSRLTFTKGGSIRVLSTQESNSNAQLTALTGQGSPNIVQDESSIITDASYAMTWRMLGGQTEEDGGEAVDLGFILKIGNPFLNNHFHRTWDDPDWHKLFIDYKQGLEEGRYTESFIEKARKELMFGILYECEFPEEDMIMEDGYEQLIPYELYKNALVKPGTVQHEGQMHFGYDLAGGGNDRNVTIERSNTLMRFRWQNKDENTMDQYEKIKVDKATTGVEWKQIAIDTTGIGQGVGDRFHKERCYTKNIHFGSGAPKEVQYVDGRKVRVPAHNAKNMRAYMYLELRQWLVDGGKIEEHPVFDELLLVNVRVDPEKKLQLQAKEVLKARMKKLKMDAESPDGADAAALTFAKKTKASGEDAVATI